jgi:hypothetical protein
VIPTAGASSDPFRSDAAELGPIVWATEIDPATNAPRQPAAEAPTDAPVLYATLPAAWLRRGTTVTAAWSYNGTPLAGFVSTTSADRDQRGVWIEFHIARRGEAPWPEGTYAVEVLVDGTPAQRAAIIVRPSLPG